VFVLVLLSGAYNTGSHCKCATFGNGEFSAHSALTQHGGVLRISVIEAARALKCLFTLFGVSENNCPFRYAILGRRSILACSTLDPTL